MHAPSERGPTTTLTVDDVGRAGDAGATSHFDEPEYYDKAYRHRFEDVEFYMRLAERSGGPVLEFGVGTGRVALPIARAGVSVTGVDRSTEMLSELRRKVAGEPKDVRRRMRVVRGDMRRLRLQRRFPLVIAPFNAVLHLYDRADVEAFFSTVRAHLAPRGRLVFDFSLPRAENLNADPNHRYGAPRFRHPRTQSLVRYGERFEYDPFRQVLLVSMEFSPLDGNEPWTVPLAQRQFFPQEMAVLLHYNGFSDLRWYPDFTEGTPGRDTNFVAVSCGASARRS